MIRFAGHAGNAIVADVAGSMEGRPVLLLHGGGQTRHAWRAVHDALAERGYLAISPDARGHGDSDWTTAEGYSISDMARDLRCIIASLHGPIAMIGASMGGLAALTALDQDPSLDCFALALVDVVPRPSHVGIAAVKTFMSASPNGFATLEEAADAVSAYLPQRKRPSSPDGLRKNLRLGANGRYFWHWDPAFLDFRQDDFASSQQLEARLAALSTPVMLVRGRESDVVTEAEVDRFRQIAPDAVVADVGGAAHMVAGDRNDAFMEAIEGFLTQADQATTRGSAGTAARDG